MRRDSAHLNWSPRVRIIWSMSAIVRFLVDVGDEHHRYPVKHGILAATLITYQMRRLTVLTQMTAIDRAHQDRCKSRVYETQRAPSITARILATASSTDA